MAGINYPAAPCSLILLRLNIPLGRQKFCAQNRASRRSPDRVVGKSYEFIIIDRILPQPSDGDPHASLKVHVKADLGPVVLLHVAHKLLRRAGKVKLLGKSFILLQFLDQLFLCRLFPELDKSCRRVAV